MKISTIDYSWKYEQYFSAGEWILPMREVIGESKLGRLVDALALGGDEGRDKLR